MELPYFKYHPNPLQTGAIIESQKVCQCCHQVKGYIYVASIYSEEEVDDVCPWCIKDGSVAKKFEATFNDDHPLLEAGVSAEVVEEVCERTPGYCTWQQEVWQTHCNTACIFHGDAKKEDLEGLLGEDLDSFLKYQMIDKVFWQKILDNYNEGGDTAIYKFECSVCAKAVFALDFS